jgi:hypothetical protein
MLDTLLIAALALAITVVMIGEASILRALLAGFGRGSAEPSGTTPIRS